MAGELLKPRETQESPRNFFNLLERRQIAANTLLCVGLDSDTTKVPSMIKRYFIDKEGIRIGLQEFNATIIHATHDLVCAYKPNIAFYEEHGKEGLDALLWTMEYIKQEHRDIPIIPDAKRTDISNTNLPYARMAFDLFGADAITVNPYFGGEAIQPFLDRKDKGVVVLCRTSNPGAKDFQDLPISLDILPKEAREFFANLWTGMKAIHLYEYVAYRAAHEWNKNGNVSLVVGATYPEELAQVRKIVGDKMPILIPGLGAQEGKPENLPGGFNSQKRNVIANISQAVIFAEPKEGETFSQAVRKEAMKWRDVINVYR